MQPGQTITPGGSTLEPSDENNQDEVKIDHSKSSVINENQNIPPSPEPSPIPTPEPVSHPQEPQPLPPPSPDPSHPEPGSDNSGDHNSDSLSWTASEFIEHEKPSGWYVTVIGGAVVLSVILYLLVQDFVTVVVVAIAAIMFAVVGSRKPRSLNYSISTGGIQVGDKSFGFDRFKSFSVIEEGAIDSIQLLPLQRFAPPISLYFPPDKEREITELIGDYLPYEERTHDAIDRLMKRFHF